MASIKLGIGLSNQMSGQLEKINKQLASLESKVNAVQQKNDKLSKSQMTSLVNSFNQVNNSIKAVNNNLDLMQQKNNNAKEGFGGLSKAMIVGNQAMGLLSQGANMIGGILKTSDAYMQTNARLALINDGLRTNKELQDQIYKSAERSRSSYTETADSISKMGLLAGDAFKNNDELIKFTELINKSSKISGADPSQTAGAMRQLTQGLSAGALRGDEYISVSENLPMVKNAIADYLKVSTGGLRKLAAEGKITADVIKNAMFQSGSKIEAMFDSMPMTFGDSATKMQNIINRTLGQVGQTILPKVQEFMSRVSEFLGQAQIQQFISGIIVTLMILGDVLMFVLGILSSVFTFVIDNWGTISTILMILGAIMLPIIISSLYTLISGWIIAGAKAIIAGIQMFIGAMLALGPLGLIILAIIAIITILKLLGVSFEKIFGFIGGLIGGLFALAYNVVIVKLWNTIAAFANFFANVFRDPVYSIKKLFVDLLNTILDIVKNVSKVIDKVMGTHLADGIGKFQGNMKKWLGKSDKYKDVMPKLEQMDINNAIGTGGKIGGAIGKKLDGFVSGAQNLFGGMKLSETPNVSKSVAGLDKKVPVEVQGGKLDKGGEVQITEEDLKSLKDIASQEFMLRYRQVSPTMNVTFGDIKETADVNKIKRIIEKMTEEELANMYVEEVA
nr:MAG TPA: Tail tape measure [Caudoviricetes sp.]